MCRHIGYIGIKKSLREVLIDKEHSIITMAYKPKEMKEAILNADGFGIGWFKAENFFTYKKVCPIWNDENLNSIAENISSDLIIGNVRSATILSNSGTQNTHPFLDKNFIFSHNGYIKNFESKVKEKFIRLIENKFLKTIKGNTDSEYIFTLFRQNYYYLKSGKKSIIKTIDQITKISQASLLNFLIAINDKREKRIIATKFGHNLEAPSLYYYNNNKTNQNIISSEKLDSNNWKSISNNSIIEVTKKTNKIINF